MGLSCILANHNAYQSNFPLNWVSHHNTEKQNCLTAQNTLQQCHSLVWHRAVLNLSKAVKLLRYRKENEVTDKRTAQTEGHQTVFTPFYPKIGHDPVNPDPFNLFASWEHCLIFASDILHELISSSAKLKKRRINKTVTAKCHCHHCSGQCYSEFLMVTLKTI